MHLSCYKIRSYYYYLLPSLRRTSTVFTSCVTSKSYKSCTDVQQISTFSSKRLTFPRISFIPIPFYSLLSPLALSFSSRPIYLAHSRRCVLSARSREGNTPGIVLILSYVAAAIVSSLRSSAIPLTAAYVSNACRGMSGDSLRRERERRERRRDARMQRGSHQRRNYWELVFYGLCASFLR